ncbi:hypothetical protein DR950_25740 [Kitasatospora xanthocidica]|uniref:Uncharacterized protein n=1 Tax=Kitasatospora xanthocidica TaxID=83382 RepID=A0A372ZXX8_9ACTN|nr:hypothetical protein [Kitasatospora xanthocidica]RGD60723.1 hypothetical protein DR950_25740 [Kitasatospora xanthocidica]
MTFETGMWIALAATPIGLALAVAVIGILGCVAIRKAPPTDVPKVLTALASVVRAFRDLVPRNRPISPAPAIPIQRTETPTPVQAAIIAGELTRSTSATDAQ